jgi:hypothetical protein
VPAEQLRQAKLEENRKLAILQRISSKITKSKEKTDEQNLTV